MWQKRLMAVIGNCPESVIDEFTIQDYMREQSNGE